MPPRHRPWPALSDHLLEDPGDLPVVHNYRNVLAPILSHHDADNSLGTVFRDFAL